MCRKHVCRIINKQLEISKRLQIIKKTLSNNKLIKSEQCSRINSNKKRSKTGSVITDIKNRCNARKILELL